MWRQLQSSNLFIWGIVFVGCIGSRLLSTIYYIEDLDSLRFALSMVDYDVAKLQPHFPAYPVFCFVAKLFYTLIRRYALAFSLLGGLSTFFIIFFALKIAKIQSVTTLGKIAIFVIFMTPLLWLMSNRYMPDAMGVACLLASLYFIMAQAESGRNTLLCRNTIGFFFAGILLGIRLSYLPLLVPALLMRLKHTNRLKFIGAGAIGILIWLIPLLWITGLNTLITAAQTQSHGHFSDFGGTVSTNPELWMRFTKTFESIFADGFGLYWLGRHLITACTTLILLGIIIVANWQTVKRWFVRKQFGGKSLFLNPIFLGCVLYFVWIFFAQNVIHKSRHVLPLLPFLALGIAFSCHRIIALQGTALNRKQGKIGWGIVIIFFLCYSYVTLHTVVQHTKPTAIAQIHKYLHHKQNEQGKKLNIVSVPLIKYYLVSQGVEANYIPIKSEADLAQLDELETGIVAIGGPLPNRIPKVEKIFFHNPYVNRMWPELSLFEY
ncbi:hypothetical protein C6501_00060 [Candidatus Poribacteria bacterium]|nr:MAG: hypothetical protein C6501_00060 [Candidatus Poribacteria bacterium]